MVGGRFRLLGVTASIWTVGCGGDAVVHREAVPSATPDARATRMDGGNAGIPTKPPAVVDASVSSHDADSSAPADADSTTSVDAHDATTITDAKPASCTVAPARDLDGGMCLGIYYALVAELVLWVQDRSAADGGSRVTLAKGDTVRVGGHTYGYSGNSLITSGSGVEIHLDVDGVRDSLSFELNGCAPRTGNRTWDYPATLTRTTCSGCASTSSGRHYSVVETHVDGGMVYTFDADLPARSCGVGFDLLSFTTSPL